MKYFKMLLQKLLRTGQFIRLLSFFVVFTFCFSSFGQNEYLVKFGFDQHTILDSSALESLLNEHGSNNITEIVLEGRADSTGPDSYNQYLSDLRSKAVKNWIAENLPSMADKIQMSNYGENSPLADNSSPTGRAKNRSVRIMVFSEASQEISSNNFDDTSVDSSDDSLFESDAPLEELSQTTQDDSFPDESFDDSFGDSSEESFDDSFGDSGEEVADLGFDQVDNSDIDGDSFDEDLDIGEAVSDSSSETTQIVTNQSGFKRGLSNYSVALAAYKADMSGEYVNASTLLIPPIESFGSEFRADLVGSLDYRLSKKWAIPMEVGLRMNEVAEQATTQVVSGANVQNNLLELNEISFRAGLGIKHYTLPWLSNKLLVSYDSQLTHNHGQDPNGVNVIEPITEPVVRVDFRPEFTLMGQKKMSIIIEPEASYIHGLEENGIASGTSFGGLIGLDILKKKLRIFGKYRMGSLEAEPLNSATPPTIEPRDAETTDMSFGIRYKF